ncbi:MAG: hypothetical protein JOY71_14065 [Acetobacteraceae bacterium]|nr:hypothetical protein [Acetobacteraceae bacterium]MBV8523226.1 hypothetical protein [Acetobacteraceae bacterium]
MKMTSRPWSATSRAAKSGACVGSRTPRRSIGFLLPADVAGSIATVLTPVAANRIRRVRVGAVLRDEFEA